MDRTAALILVLACAAARADEASDVDVHGGTRVFVQPTSGDALLILTPAVAGSAAVRDWLRVDVNWVADIVTGATPRTYGKAIDVVTSATSFTEVRNVFGGGAEAKLGALALDVGYSYGRESDYRSHQIRAGARLDLFEHNTVVAVGWAHDFDSVCDVAQSTLPLLQRQPLDRSAGCFASTPGLTEQSLAVDGIEASIAQTLTPRLVLALAGSYAHLDGFQSSPYRRVSLDGGLLQVQESHPRLRDRGALGVRLRRAMPWGASLGIDVRGYRDSWGITSLTGELLWDQPLGATSPWRFAARARGYVQTGAFFYRDAGSADSYEKAGPVGQYFTADQELAPLADLVLGARFIYGMHRASDDRIWGLFDTGDVTLSADWMKTFALTPDPPNFARTQGWATAVVVGFSLALRR